MMPTTSVDYDPTPLSSMEFWALTADEREHSFSVLRNDRPLSWHPPVEGTLIPHDDDPGYWAIVRHEDVTALSRNPTIFCSGQGAMFEDAPAFLNEAVTSLLAMDAPRHTNLRRLISSAFTPRQVATLEKQIRRQARSIVDDLLPLGECDFVAQVSRRLPTWTISEMMGVAPEDRERVTHAADGLIGFNDPEVQQGREALQVVMDSMVTLHTAARELAAERHKHPTDDLMTALVLAEVDSERLTDDEICAFFCLLAVAGNDTTRNSISHGLKALADNPDQRTLLVDDFPGRIRGAVEEIIRWATPVLTFRRTATRDVELHGRTIEEGDKVVFFYSSANRDERAFVDPMRFDIERRPNEHVGFGGGGPHFCLGASLARTQLRAILDQLLHRVTDMEFGEPEYLVGNIIHGIKAMPCRFSPAPR